MDGEHDDPSRSGKLSVVPAEPGNVEARADGNQACHFIRVLLTSAIYPDTNQAIVMPRTASMTPIPFPQFTAFEGQRRLVSGSLADVALAVQKVTGGSSSPILIVDDSTGRPIDLDLRGTDREILKRLPQPAESAEDTPSLSEPRGRGRPKLGVVAREVTLLPRHWEWLAAQPGGASVSLRKLVEDARRANGDRDRNRAARDAAYHFMSAIAGDLPGFEEAARALFADDRRRFVALMAAWPEDVRDHTVRLAFGDRAEPPVDPADVNR
jgi:uncharacterized protein